LGQLSLQGLTIMVLVIAATRPDLTTTVEVPTTTAEVPTTADAAGGATDIECAVAGNRI
jgi:hypothetical protein